MNPQLQLITHTHTPRRIHNPPLPPALYGKQRGCITEGPLQLCNDLGSRQDRVGRWGFHIINSHTDTVSLTHTRIKGMHTRTHNQFPQRDRCTSAQVQMLEQMERMKESRHCPKYMGSVEP